MSFTVISIGKKHESWVSEGIERYEKRLREPFTLKWVLLPHSSREGLEAREEESKAILNRLKPTDYVILLDERGRLINSPALSEHLESKINMSHSIVFIIGGAYGVNDTLRDRAEYQLSLSPLVLPHQLVRLVLTEQIYRAQEISRGGSYHHA